MIFVSSKNSVYNHSQAVSMEAANVKMDILHLIQIGALKILFLSVGFVT